MIKYFLSFHTFKNILFLKQYRIWIDLHFQVSWKDPGYKFTNEKELTRKLVIPDTFTIQWLCRLLFKVNTPFFKLNNVIISVDLTSTKAQSQKHETPFSCEECYCCILSSRSTIVATLLIKRKHFCYAKNVIKSPFFILSKVHFMMYCSCSQQVKDGVIW